MNIIKKIVCLLVCAVLTFMTSACKNRTPVPQDEIIYYMISTEPETLDPQIANDSASKMIIMNIFEGLVRIDENEDPIPGAAESWDISEGGTVYTFHLRKDAHWSNGDSVTAEDFLFGLQRTIHPQTGSTSAGTLFSIRNAQAVNSGQADISKLGVYVLDDFTLKIELDDNYPGFLPLLATAPAMPCHREFFEQTGGQYGRESRKLISNGAFYIRESGWEHGEYINLRRNGEYSGESEPIPAGVNIEISERPENVCGAILSGKTDCYALPAAELKSAQENKFHITSFGDTVWGIAFNTQNDILKSPDVRKALLSALDRKYILKELPEGCTVTNEIIPEGAQLNGISYRKSAGSVMNISYSDKSSDALKKALKKLNADSLPKLSILCTDDEPTQKIVNNIIETWNSITGNYINKTPVSRSELNDMIITGEYRVVVAPLISDGESPVDTLELFRSDSKYNIAQLTDVAYDKLLNNIQLKRTSVDKVISAEKYLCDNGIFYPLYLESRYYACASNVTGIIFHPYGAEVDFFSAAKVRQ